MRTTTTTTTIARPTGSTRRSRPTDAPTGPARPGVRTLPATVAVLTALVLTMLVQLSPAQAATTCSTRWGSLPKTAGLYRGADVTLSGVRSGRHACFDRLVLDISRGTAPGYHVSYVREVRTDGEGALVPLRGGARLAVIAVAPAYDEHGHPAYVPANPREIAPTAGFRTFRQVAWAGSFEGQSTIGLGVRARLPFRVFTLHSSTGNRLVVDVAHRW